MLEYEVEVTHIGDSNADLAKMLDKSELTIREHCDSLRLKVDIAREIGTENLHKASNALMIEIDAYERECFHSCSTVKQPTEDVVESVSKRMRAFLAEQQEHLQNVKASDDEVMLQLDETNKLAQEHGERKQELNATIFANKLASFVAFPINADVSIGELAFVPIQPPFNTLDMASA